jgi:pilus assembly protein Flp/PilA
MGELAFGRGGAVEGEVISGKRKTGEYDETGKAIMKGRQEGRKNFQNQITSKERLKMERRMRMKKLIGFFKDEEGATAVEYGLMVALIAVAIITAVTLVGTNLTALFNEIAGELELDSLLSKIA